MPIRKNTQPKGVFCLEGMWSPDLRDTSSVRPILELLRVRCEIDYIYRDCATQGEFELYLKKWVQRTYDAFPILYLASHGVEFGIDLGQHTCDLDEIAGILGDRCENRIVMFACCAAVGTDKRHLIRFLKRTGALAVCGYRTDVDWLKSIAFELLLLAEMQDNEFSGRGIGAIQANAVQIARGFRELDFRMVTCKEV